MFASIQADQVTQWTAGIDWVTMTWRDDSESGAYQVVRGVGYDAAHECSDGSLTPEYAVIQGYKGTRCGRVFTGLMKGQGVLLSATGEAAHWLVAHSGLEPDNVARCDVQATFWSEGDIGHLPKQVAQRSAAARIGAKGRPWKVKCYDGFGEGDTAYLGSRQSDSFLRCYDKGRESGEAFYNKAVRYEGEFKREWALRCYHHLLERQCGRFECFNVVARAFERRGVDVPAIRPLGAPMAPPRDDVADGIDRKLRWYEEQVSPSVAKLLTQGVSRAKILASLGL